VLVMWFGVPCCGLESVGVGCGQYVLSVGRVKGENSVVHPTSSSGIRRVKVETRKNFFN
jgi:hypothetical protein